MKQKIICNVGAWVRGPHRINFTVLLDLMGITKLFGSNIAFNLLTSAPSFWPLFKDASLGFGTFVKSLYPLVRISSSMSSTLISTNREATFTKKIFGKNFLLRKSPNAIRCKGTISYLLSRKVTSHLWRLNKSILPLFD